MTNRHLFILGLLICCACLVGAAYLQYIEGLEPCPMCMVQRWAIIALTVWFIIALVHNRTSSSAQCVYGIGIILFSGLGGFTAARQVWLQHLPPEAQPACGPGFDYLLENFPLTEALHYIFAGDGNCAIVDWTFLGQSLATWSLVIFVFLVLLGAAVIIRSLKK